MQTWQMQEAKARMSELVKRAQTQPQDITLHGKSVAVVISRETFNRLSQAQDSLVDFMRRSPLYDTDDIALERDQSLPRDVAF
ncbi:type II toxin-antitoxin system Phd/YefM family antitoxin [Pusillimonas sp. MFBS29]|uniref:type II toxin-antitoxin system Phd/YefM family antitoxin n=1 Tax=Pusillimonas sp. MFBS29 TaxID=2886690 RepID=UPI001D0F5B23|nr:type II toxin-antitoxin system Phd/YefM family antitoxin [Pusillimonas sp. MFBS29]MCC2596144.1 type II toxin-antitoxin system Phd/YefM family antitoxin [Pusillimonas sp. MFBS29]